MTASALPAVFIRCAMSVVPTPLSREEVLGVDLDEIAEMAESIEEFLGALLAGSARTLDWPAMVDDWPIGEPLEGWTAMAESETLRVSFGSCGERGGAGLEEAVSTFVLEGRFRHRARLWKENPWRTHPGLLSSGVAVPEESLL
jgi:hypothetical protein